MMVGRLTARVASDLERGRKASKIAPPVTLRLGDPQTSSPDFRRVRSSTSGPVEQYRNVTWDCLLVLSCVPFALFSSPNTVFKIWSAHHLRPPCTTRLPSPLSRPPVLPLHQIARFHTDQIDFEKRGAQRIQHPSQPQLWNRPDRTGPDRSRTALSFVYSFIDCVTGAQLRHRARTNLSWELFPTAPAHYVIKTAASLTFTIQIDRPRYSEEIAPCSSRQTRIILTVFYRSWARYIQTNLI